jgi:hypothetical protein
VQYVVFVIERSPYNIYFFDCPFAKIVWRIIYMTFWFGSTKEYQQFVWELAQGHPKETQIRVGVCAVIWTMWNTRNDFIFNKPKTSSFLQVIPMVVHRIRTWSYLQQEEQRVEMDSGCNSLETVAQDLFNRCD